MPKFFVNNNQINGDKITIVGEDVKHISNVLRSKGGDTINICDVDTSDNYIAELTDFSKDSVIATIEKKIKSEAEPDIYVHIFQGIPKSDKMELIIQKSVELGVKEITPVEMERCISIISGKDEKKKIDRWQKISEVAAKQSGRDIIPKINNVVKIKNIQERIKDIDLLIVPYENAEDVSFKEIIDDAKKNERIKSIGIVIGPEGGFEMEEVEFLSSVGAKIVTLGKRILRTETVALAMSSVIMYEFGGSI